MTLHRLVGHDGVRESVATAHLRGALPAALLLKGERGIGKGRLAQWIAQLCV